jgi:hypothetical protein
MMIYSIYGKERKRRKGMNESMGAPEKKIWLSESFGFA